MMSDTAFSPIATIAAKDIRDAKRDREVPFASLPFTFRNVHPVPCQGAGILGAAFDPLHVVAEATGVNERYLTNSAAYHKSVAREDKARDGHRLRPPADGRVCAHAVWACSR